MPIDAASPRFPLHETLARFFSMDRRSRISLETLANLLGTTPQIIRRIVAADDPSAVNGAVSWSEAAAHLFDAWPRTHIFEGLGADYAHLIPAHCHPTRVHWSLPIFLVRAMEHQASAEWRRDPRVLSSISPGHTSARGVDDYVADLLFNEIQPETLHAFREDESFLAAYHYPVD